MWVGASSLLLAACSDHPMAPRPVPLPVCAAGRGFQVALAVDSFVSVDPIRDSGCIIFPANASAIDSVEYLLVPQSAAGTFGVSSSFQLLGDTIHPPAAALVASLSPPALSVAQQFHAFLRRGERLHWYGFAPQEAPPPAALPSLTLTGPPPTGDVRAFSVCSKIDCSTFKTVNATAKVVRGHMALYVDNLAPANGLNQADLDTLTDLFNSRIYPLDTAAFGNVSDIDNNTVVIVLMTNVVNQLTPKNVCGGGYIAGFFLGADLDPRFARDNRVNHGEIFYSIVADSAGVLSCIHSRTAAKQDVPITFTHEFQHMISFAEHVLFRPGQSEEGWLTEGLSKYAEELIGRSYLPGDSVTFVRYVKEDRYDAYQYLSAPGNSPLLIELDQGTLAEIGASWLFVRYLVDQFGDSLPLKLNQTTKTGADNVTTQTGVGFDTLLARWALANWVSDLAVPGFTAAPTLKYSSWNFRATYAALNSSDPFRFPKPYPLVPTVSAGNLTDVTGVLYAGSGAYHRALQGPLASGFQLQFGDGGANYLPASIVPRLTIIRIR